MEHQEQEKREGKKAGCGAAHKGLAGYGPMGLNLRQGKRFHKNMGEP